MFKLVYMFKLVTGIFQLLTCTFQLLTGIFKLINWYIQVSKIKKIDSPDLPSYFYFLQKYNFDKYQAIHDHYNTSMLHAKQEGMKTITTARGDLIAYVQEVNCFPYFYFI